MYRFLTLLLLPVVACSSTPTSVLVNVVGDQSVRAVDQIKLYVFDGVEAPVFQRRLPPTPKDDLLPSSVVLYPKGASELRLHVQALRGGAEVGEGVAKVVAVDGEQVVVTVTVMSGKMPDADGDNVPDEIDNCKDKPNPRQEPCASEDGGVEDGQPPKEGGVTDSRSTDGDGPRAPDGPLLPDGLTPDITVDDGPCKKITVYVDSDGDGFGTGSAKSVCSPVPAGHATKNGDCDDKDKSVWQLLVGYPDSDGDGRGATRGATGTKSPGTVVDDASTGTIAWVNPGDAKTANGVSAEATLNRDEVSHYLKATNFNFAIPSQAIVTGIRVVYAKGAPNTNHVRDVTIRLLKAGSIVGDNKSKGALGTWPKPPYASSYGGSSSLWGTTWTPSDINSSGFGVTISVRSTGPKATPAMVDHVKIEIYYKWTAGTKVCSGASLPSGVVSSSDDCEYDDDKRWRLLTGYPDGDNDSYHALTSEKVCSGNALPSSYSTKAGTDCYDRNGNARPGQQTYYSAHRGDGSFDYNCDGRVVRRYSSSTVACSTTAVRSYLSRKTCTACACTAATGSTRTCAGSKAPPTSCGSTFYQASGTTYYSDVACATSLGPGTTSRTQSCR